MSNLKIRTQELNQRFANFIEEPPVQTAFVWLSIQKFYKYYIHFHTKMKKKKKIKTRKYISQFILLAYGPDKVKSHLVAYIRNVKEDNTTPKSTSERENQLFLAPSSAPKQNKTETGMGNKFPFTQRPGLFRTNRLSCLKRRRLWYLAVNWKKPLSNIQRGSRPRERKIKMQRGNTDFSLQS